MNRTAAGAVEPAYDAVMATTTPAIVKAAYRAARIASAAVLAAWTRLERGLAVEAANVDALQAECEHAQAADAWAWAVVFHGARLDWSRASGGAATAALELPVAAKLSVVSEETKDSR